MGLLTRILRNTTYLTLGDKFGYLIQFIFFLYFARKFGVVPTGEYSFGFTFAYAVAVFADLGISVYLVREVSRNYSKGRRLFFDCLLLRAILLILVSLLASTTIILFFDDISSQKLKVIGFWGAYWIFYSLADVFLAELNGHEKMGQVALLGICLKLLSTITGVLLIYLGLDYVLVLIVLPISSFIYLCACVLCSTYYLGPIIIKFRSITYYKNLFAKLLPFYFTVILVEILWCQDILILGFMHGDKSVGIYSSAIKIVAFILGISPFFHTAMLPILSRLFIESKEKLIDISEKILRYLIISSLPVSFGLAMTADKIIELLYSDLFHGASIVIKIAGWAIAAGFIQAIFSVLLTAINRQKEKVVFVGITFAISTLLNIVFIYYFNYVGAAIMKLVTAIIGLIFFIYLVSKYLALLSILKYILKPAFASSIMVIFVYCFSNWGLVYLIPVSAFLYLGSLLLLGTFTAQEIGFIKDLVPKRIYGR